MPVRRDGADILLAIRLTPRAARMRWKAAKAKDAARIRAGSPNSASVSVWLEIAPAHHAPNGSSGPITGM